MRVSMSWIERRVVNYTTMYKALRSEAKAAISEKVYLSIFKQSELVLSYLPLLLNSAYPLIIIPNTILHFSLLLRK